MKKNNSIVEKVAKSTIGYELLGLDISGQWYDSIENGGGKITPKIVKKC